MAIWGKRWRQMSEFGKRSTVIDLHQFSNLITFLISLFDLRTPQTRGFCSWWPTNSSNSTYPIFWMVLRVTSELSMLILSIPKCSLISILMALISSLIAPILSWIALYYSMPLDSCSLFIWLIRRCYSWYILVWVAFICLTSFINCSCMRCILRTRPSHWPES